MTLEIKKLLPELNEFINNNKYLVKIKRIILNGGVSSKIVGNFNEFAKNIFSTLSTIVYSFIISFFLSANNLKINHKIFRNIPTKLVKNISKNLRIYVKGTFLDMLVLFILASIAFFFTDLPGFLIFALFIALTNVIP